MCFFRISWSKYSRVLGWKLSSKLIDMIEITIFAWFIDIQALNESVVAYDEFSSELS